MQRPRLRLALSLATTLIIAPAGCAAPSDAPNDASASTAVTTAARQPTSSSALVDRLRVAPSDPTAPPYVRARFGEDWEYDPTSGCNTRERVLIEESMVPPRVDERCRSTLGRWRSVYDGIETTDPSDLEIDHLVPLADAWRSGAHRWDEQRRRSFANHLADPEELVAVSSTSNRSKSDSTPDQWLPPERAAWCTYASEWVQVKARWELSVTPAEKAALVRVLEGC